MVIPTIVQYLWPLSQTTLAKSLQIQYKMVKFKIVITFEIIMI